MTEGKMAGWHHRLNGHEFEQAPEDGEGQGSLVCCSPWGHKELDTTQRLNINNIVDLQCRANVCCTQSDSVIYIYTFFRPFIF